MYSLKEMTSRVSSRHRLKQTKSRMKPHFTSSITLRERKEVLTTWARWESMMKVDPAWGFLGVTEKISSMPPVIGPPAPALILIPIYLNLTSRGRNECSCQNRFASAAWYDPTSKVWSPFPVPQTWTCQSPADRRIPYQSTVIGSMIRNRSTPGMQPLILKISDIQRFSRWDFCRLPS